MGQTLLLGIRDINRFELEPCNYSGRISPEEQQQSLQKTDVTARQSERLMKETVRHNVGRRQTENNISACT